VLLRLGAVALALSCAATLAGCSADSPAPSQQSDSTPGAQAGEEVVEPVKIMTSLRGTDVAVDQRLEVVASGGTLRKVTVSSAAGPLSGALSDDGTGWLASGRLEPGTAYAVRSVAERSDGHRVVKTTRFATKDLTLDEQTYASVAPLDGETVGVGMPVIVTFDIPVTNRAAIEKHMTVTSTPKQPGSWRWLSATEAHWRPKSYWKAGSQVKVDLDINSVNAGGGIYGQESRTVDFEVGDAHVYRVNAQTHQMQVFKNGSLLRTIPITTGKQGFTTRSGTKVIIEKFLEKRMNSETVGIGADDPEFYDIDDVQFAMRVTYSGEFIHAAPWSVSSQGFANVSHGCTGMSTADAAWLYDLTLRGDVVEYTGTDRYMTLENGYGDWNLPFADYRAGSALG
jgi:lipoprotein-anchoring transpeptidase ErfK/SrfK